MRKSIFIFFITLSNIFLFAGNVFCQSTITFNYTGSAQTWTVPSCVTTITVTAKGAQGGGGTNGGLGATVTATFTVTPGQVFQINVGGQGAAAGVGWNGGGTGWTGNASSFGGGGASDIRVTPYALGNRLIVAAGGGGENGGAPTTNLVAGGNGGCASGVAGAGSPYTITGGVGGTQTAGGAGGPPWSGGGFVGQNGSLGQGGDGGHDPTFGASGGGGGGGYYGGGGGGSDGCCSGSNGGGAGGGGSSFVPAGGNCSAGNNTGNGIVTITISAGGLSSTMSSTNPNCSGGTGSASISMTGGTAPFTYVWNPSGGNSSAATGLSAGNYTVLITDGTGCTSTNTVTITIPTALTVSVVSTTTVNCGANNGTATVSGNGGTGTITYSWNTTPPQTGPTANNLAAGNYVVTLTDANGCTVTQAVTITGSGSYSVTPSQTNIKCFGINNGSATVTTSGGTSPFTYAWSTIPVQTTPTISNIPAGNYTCTITDATGCVQTAVVIITQPAPLTAIITSSTNETCPGIKNGSATASGSGGTGTLNYSWNTNPAQAGATANNLSAGNYIVTITDANSCTKTASVTITAPSSMTVTTSSTPSPCGTSIGTATANSSGGVTPYTFLWLTNPVQTTPTANGLTGGMTYTIIVTDANGCTQMQSVAVGGGAPPIADFLYIPSDIVSLLDPIVDFTDASTGNPTIWSWNFGDPNSGTNNISSSQNPSHVYSDTGIYCISLSISDPAGFCKDSITKCLKVESPYTFYIPNSFTPNSDGFNEFFSAYGTYIKEFSMKIFDRWGNLVWKCHTFGDPQLDSNCLWEGKVKSKGQLVQEDVYEWAVELVDFKDKNHKYIGHLTMIK